jgi:CHRD domain
MCGGGNPFGCPNNGKIKGVINIGDLRNLPEQNIARDDFDKFLRALFAGKLYVQIKTTRVPTGEIRGQIKPLAFQ